MSPLGGRAINTFIRARSPGGARESPQALSLQMGDTGERGSDSGGAFPSPTPASHPPPLSPILRLPNTHTPQSAHSGGGNVY